MSMADDAPPAMPRSEPFGMMHEHEPDPTTYAASNHDARRGNGRPPKCCHYLDGMPEPTMPCCAECVNKPADTCAV